MSVRITTAALSAAFLAGAVAIAHAQGYVTQDPGSQAPRNLTLQYLGPSGAGPTVPNEPVPGGVPPLRFPSGRRAAPATDGYGSGSGTGTVGGGYWTSRSGSGR